jgi:hypothetical protein
VPGSAISFLIVSDTSANRAATHRSARLSANPCKKAMPKNIPEAAGHDGLESRVRSPADAIAATQRECESHTSFFELAACDCTCECWDYIGNPKDTRPPPNRRPFPPLSHRINVLIQILQPCAAWRCLEVERAMGIEPTRRVFETSGLAQMLMPSVISV